MATVPSFYIGAAPVVTITCKNIAGVLTDPTGLTVTVHRDGAVNTVYTYLTDAALTKTSVGIYSLAHPVLAVAGMYEVKPVATGAVAASDQTAFNVPASNV